MTNHLIRAQGDRHDRGGRWFNPIDSNSARRRPGRVDVSVAFSMPECGARTSQCQHGVNDDRPAGYQWCRRRLVRTVGRVEQFNSLERHSKGCHFDAPDRVSRHERCMGSKHQHRFERFYLDDRSTAFSGSQFDGLSAPAIRGKGKGRGKASLLSRNRKPSNFRASACQVSRRRSRRHQRRSQCELVHGLHTFRVHRVNPFPSLHRILMR